MTFKQKIASGYYQLVLISPEQLGRVDGHQTRFSRLVETDSKFRKKIRRIFVDEAHNIRTAGLDLYGLSAFRPAWGKLGYLRKQLGHGVPCLALSGTIPPHIETSICKSLHFHKDDMFSIKATANRKNITYLTYPVFGGLSNFVNLRFLLPLVVTAIRRGDIPKAMIFHDNRTEANNAAIYLASHLPEDLQDAVAHWHSWMSEEYCDRTREDFQKPDSIC